MINSVIEGHSCKITDYFFPQTDLRGVSHPLLSSVLVKF